MIIHSESAKINTYNNNNSFRSRNFLSSTSNIKRTNTFNKNANNNTNNKTDMQYILNQNNNKNANNNSNRNLSNMNINQINDDKKQ